MPFIQVRDWILDWLGLLLIGSPSTPRWRRLEYLTGAVIVLAFLFDGYIYWLDAGHISFVCLVLLPAFVWLKAFREMRTFVLSGTMDSLRYTPLGVNLAQRWIAGKSVASAAPIYFAWLGGLLAFGADWELSLAPALISGAAFTTLLYPVFILIPAANLGRRIALEHHENREMFARLLLRALTLWIFLPSIILLPLLGTVLYVLFNAQTSPRIVSFLAIPLLTAALVGVLLFWYGKGLHDFIRWLHRRSADSEF